MGGVVSQFDSEYVRLKKYLDDGGNPNVYTQYKSQLFIHIEKENIACVKLLIERGANPNQQVYSSNSWPPLM